MDKVMNSKEFISEIGISMKKLECLEKEGVIVPIRDGRIRYYNQSHIDTYNKYNEDRKHGKINKKTKETKSTVTFAFSDKAIRALMLYCSENNIYINDSVVITNQDDIYKSVIGEFQSYDIEKVIYCSDDGYGDMIKIIAKHYGVSFIKDILIQDYINIDDIIDNKNNKIGIKGRIKEVFKRG